MLQIPFPGNKRFWVKKIESIICERGYKTIYEPFGGSAIISVNCINDGIVENAVINDYDGFFDLYPDYLNKKEEIIQKCLEHGIEKRGNTELSKDHKKFLQNLFEKTPKDYWKLLANNFVFSAQSNSSKLVLSDFRFLKNDITTKKQREYMRIVERCQRTSVDFREYFEIINKFSGDSSDGILILDPPYLNSAQRAYENDQFFDVAETIELLDLTKECGLDFIFFNSNLKNMEALVHLYNFDVKETMNRRSQVSGNKRVRDDAMIYVRQ